MSSDDEVKITDLVQKLCEGQTRGYEQVPMSEDEIYLVLDKVKVILLKRPMLLDIKAPTKVLGDIHGQFFDLLQIFDITDMPSKDNQILFLGDYVDRGKYGLETAMLLFSFKVLYPDNLHLLRGNHESRAVSRVYGFYEECKTRYNPEMWKRFMEVFDCLPAAALINKAIFCMHGGLSPHLKTFDDIKKLPRPTDIPAGGLMADLLWADPDKKLGQGWAENPRGVSFIFSKQIVVDFTEKFDLDLILRAHQVVFHGYELFADGKLITLFSAPNFCGQFENKGAMMTIDKKLRITLTVIDGAANKRKRRKGKSKSHKDDREDKNESSSSTSSGSGKKTDSEPQKLKRNSKKNKKPNETVKK